nr:IucA/IucC family protein [Pseudenhygromyxa sp. WMMC2535]
MTLPLRGRRPFELHRVDQARLDPRDDLRLDAGLGLAGGPAPLLAALFDHEGCPAPARARVLAELQDGVFNLASARLADALRSLAARATEGEGAADPRLSDPEHFVTEGHPWHPMARTRLGLGHADVLRHAPELLARARLPFVEVEADLLQVSPAWLERSEQLSGAAHRDARARGRLRLPIHPVQARRLPSLFPAAWSSGAMRLVDDGALDARSLLSLRTVALDRPPAGPPLHLKLALSVHTTSARRRVSPMSVANGPRVSALLERILATDPHTAPLSLMAEHACVGLDPERAGAAAGELGLIVRRAPPANAWVCAAMGERWPGEEARVLERACAGYPGDRGQRVRALLDDWLAKLAGPALRLLCLHGVALEVHLQNTLVAVEDGRVRGFWIRDLGGIRLHAPRLRAAGWDLALAPDSFIITEDLEEVRGKLEHTLFHANLAHLFEVAAEVGGVPEAQSWARARAFVDATLSRWAAAPELATGHRAALLDDRARLLAPRVRAKALLRMRMHDRISDYDYTEVDNALAGR